MALVLPGYVVTSHASIPRPTFTLGRPPGSDLVGIGIPGWQLIRQGYSLNWDTWLIHSLNWRWGSQVHPLHKFPNMPRCKEGDRTPERPSGRGPFGRLRMGSYEIVTFLWGTIRSRTSIKTLSRTSVRLAVHGILAVLTGAQVTTLVVSSVPLRTTK